MNPQFYDAHKCGICHMPAGLHKMDCPEHIPSAGVCHSCRGNGDHPVGWRSSGDPDQDFETCVACGGTGEGDFPVGA